MAAHQVPRLSPQHVAQQQAWLSGGASHGVARGWRRCSVDVRSGTTALVPTTAVACSRQCCRFNQEFDDTRASITTTTEPVARIVALASSKGDATCLIWKPATTA